MRITSSHLHVLTYAMEEQDRRFSDGAVLPGGKKPELRSNLLATELELQTPGESGRSRGSRRRAAGGGRLETSTSFDVRESAAASSSSSSSSGNQRNRHVPNPPPSTPRASLEEGALQQQARWSRWRRHDVDEPQPEREEKAETPAIV